MKVAVVPIKRESERTPGKNFAILDGKPIWERVLDTLMTCGQFDLVCLLGEPGMDPHPFVEFTNQRRTVETRFWYLVRPSELCQGSAGIHDILRWLHNASELSVYYGRCGQDTEDVMYFQTHVVNPFITGETIANGFEALQGSNDSVIGVVDHRQKFWHLGFRGDLEPMNHEPDAMVPTQSLAPLLEETCAYSWFWGSTIEEFGNRYGKTVGYIVVDPIEAWDIDYPWQLEVAKALSFRRGVVDRLIMAEGIHAASHSGR